MPVRMLDSRPPGLGAALHPVGDRPAVGIDGVRPLPGTFRGFRLRRFRWEGWTWVFRFSRCSARRSASASAGREQVGRQLGSEPRPEDLLGRRGRDRSAAPGRDAPSCDSRECRSKPGPTCRRRSSACEQTSPGRIPERRWSSTIAQTWRETWGRIASTNASGTGLTGSDSRTSARPRRRPGDRLEAVMDGGRDHLLPDGPLERPDDLADPLVDLVPAKAGVDHRLANGLESERPELPGQSVAIELAERPDRQPDVLRLRCGLAVLDVIGVGVTEVRQEHFVDGEIGPGGGVGHRRDVGPSPTTRR